MCAHVAVIAPAACWPPALDQVRGERSLEDRFVDLVGGRTERGGPGVVAHLVRLKLQLLRNGLRRSPAALVGLAVGPSTAAGGRRRR